MESTTANPPKQEAKKKQPVAAAPKEGAAAGEEEKKQSRKRYDHLREIEVKMQVVQQAIHEGRADAKQGYEELSFADKNKGKYMTTFPYPYMNGYLHLGKCQV
jgi:leucyl-tRNA synthetase